ncbi:hypothetical protein LDENG_00127870 [Lucifuga dentata]|nr:hypothetical protein LDENG_00127870 [Lucifuga dentata]
MQVNGISCKALIDSGSQVTTITDEFWCSHPELSKQKLQPSNIPVEGAGSQNIPHYGILNIRLEGLGQKYENVPAFVVPVTEYRSTIPLLVGTNVIRASKHHLQTEYGHNFLQMVKDSHPEWYTALLEVGGAEQQDADGYVCPIHYIGHKVYITPGKEMDMMCKLERGPMKKVYTALIESHKSYQLPDGPSLTVGKVLANVRKGSVPVKVMNLSERAMWIKPNTPLAEAFLVQNVVQWGGEGLQPNGREKGSEKHIKGRRQPRGCQSNDQVIAANLQLNHQAMVWT